MMMKIGFILFFIQSLYFIEQIYGHGYLADPPSRSSAWLFDTDFSECCQYYNHNEMSCGGTYNQWVVNGGKCSICGEPFDRKPTLLGVGDSQYLGKIVRTYTQGSVMPVTVILTANHLGVFEFRICNIDNDPSKDATQSCLDLNILQTTNGSTQYPIGPLFSTVHINITLPANLVCKHCVFQWSYKTGNSWGALNGKACLGCGKQNEEFYGCSDIAIISQVESVVNSIKTTAIKTTITTPVPPVVARQCTPSITFSQALDLTAIMGQYCQAICANDCALDKIVGNATIYHGCLQSCDKLCVCQYNIL